MLTCLYLFGISQVNSQMGTPFIKNYPPEISKSAPQNWAIVEDKRGVMYFGNGPESGVLEFDGNYWKIIAVSNHSTARSLAIDSLGKIYVGASGEFGFLAANNSGALNYVSLIHLVPKDELEFNNVLKIHTTSHGVYFVATNKIFRYYKNKITVINGTFTQRYGFNINNHLFIADENKGLMYVRDSQPEVLPYTLPIINNCGRYVILDYPGNKLLIATVNNGMFLYDLTFISNKEEIFKHNTEYNTSNKIVQKLETRVSNYLTENSLYTCTKIDDNSFAFGTLQGGVILMDAQGKLIKVINKNRGLINNTILSLYADKASNLWIGSYNGISYVETGSPLTNLNEQNGLYGTPISLITHNNNKFIGTTQGIFYVPEYSLKNVDDNHVLKPISNFDTECWNFFSLGTDLLATGYDGVYLINETQAKKIFETNEIYCFGGTKKFPNLLFLGLTDGFEYIQNESSIFSNASKANFLKAKKFPEITNKIRKIISDKNENLWLTTEYEGIINIKFDNNNVNKYEIFRYDTTSGLPQLNYNWVYNLNGEIIVGSRQGFYKPIYENNKVIKFVPDSSFGSSFVGEGAQIENLFLTTKDEAFVFQKNRGIEVIKNFTGNKIIKSNLFNKIKEPHQIFFDIDGILWIATLNDGIYLYDKQLLKNYNVQYSTLLRKIIVGKDSIIFDGAFYVDSSKVNDMFTKIVENQPANSYPVFQYEYNSIKFNFSSTFKEMPEKTEFSWMLEGFDKEWSDWSFKSEENYKKIREGDYVFKVKSKNVFNVESPAVTFRFEVLPPWHRTIWAYLGYVVLLVLFIYLIVRLNSRRLKAANIRLEKIIKERTKEIRKQRDQISEQKQAITDSIQYAKRIQNAVLPPEDYINKVLPEHFILFKPRDIVSGDFYWLKKIDKYVVFTAADCTGHGVPGAFMSMLGIALLNEIVRRKEITKASQILNELRSQIKDALRQSGKEGEAKDGMDIALCVLDTEELKLQYAGAYNPLYIIRNNELIEYKADKMPIGIHLKTQPFSNNEIQLQKNDMLYVFSDGFVDQFGGDRCRKFMIKPFKRLLTEINERPMFDQKGILDIAITEWRGEREQIDDIVVIGVRV